jgi:hypothetical protein
VHEQKAMTHWYRGKVQLLKGSLRRGDKNLGTVVTLCFFGLRAGAHAMIIGLCASTGAPLLWGDMVMW